LQFERAAGLRDEIKELEAKLEERAKKVLVEV
jgi:protein-arginine kinase activator protein McsA